ncbi:bifunctional phosphopantothenoylcysteine decarboxylase/phosphopantothenate cysteine ligase [Gottschalkia acidurici 9a]|uniref:Coenzyme A biosynthesis bifunctional protein CoaBC n=1 Tax=Gottschalkia acidurici (strain ATCC 7906 / DSM 604 / BCRC 14475 / CIP 104303 / KCTC 5404 / NCIMB 10678 / 9a) TaxID=1128398 RepID=K0AZJ9_GOTA9|nr:bifunctional phosphopantothenoylcysteine decarboxylase/phosphopantothenate--cysteine ligase CoaBC [Gottschalkia acidurici]AFS78694.1 bifunctional phosphopantothenoylcysteine decarboxylase/phosphopantothenate cysteine ligase [Gottschalkia acidurici 9a]
MLKGKNIVLGVTGGIAVYKAVDIVSRLKKLGANINVIMTNSSTKFVTPLTFQSMSQNHVTVDMFEEPKQWEIEHISLASKADIFLIAPATANIIGKVANGIADDMLSTTIMATKARVVFAPAMNTNMYVNPIFKQNVEKLKSLGYEFISPASGRLACGDYGEGKLADPVDIVEYVVNIFNNNELEGKKVLITAGPTIEPLDPVRYMTNFSSGKMGYALAEEAKRRGGEVVLITGPTSLTPPSGVSVKKVNTTREMYKAIEDEFDTCDVLIKSAAPLDYRPESVSDQKIKKSDDDLCVRFVRNPDIVAHFGNIKKHQLVVGFAAETQNILENAKKKIKSKNLDFIVANDVTSENAGFRTDNNTATIINKNGEVKGLPNMSKADLSKVILDEIGSLLRR